MDWPIGMHMNSRREADPTKNRIFQSMDEMSPYEQEVIDYALALSISEQDQNLQKLIEKEEEMMKAQVEEDEQIAIALQQSLFLLDSSLNHNKESNSKSKSYDPLSRAIESRVVCAGCNGEVMKSEHIIHCSNGIAWHAGCLFCHACKQLITDHELNMYEAHPYHTSCYGKKRSYPKCDVCNNFIPNTNNLVEYGEHPFWKQKYCLSHDHDGTSKCCSCERLEAKSYHHHVPLKDGRKLCLECYNSVIIDTDDGEFQSLFIEIQNFFNSLNMKVNQDIPLFLVEREALNEAIQGEKNNGHHHLSETRGLCLSEEQKIPVNIQMRSRIGRSHGIFEMFNHPERFLVRNCEVTAIFILYGLPRLLTGSVLAHEMMHAWLRLNGYPTLKPEVEEGICQVMAHLWLKSVISSRTQSTINASSSSSSSYSANKGRNLCETERKLGECFMRQIELDASEAYGDGFRVGQQSVSQYGLGATLHHIKLTTTFPV